MKKSPITHLFLDIGGVLLTNGWDHNARKRASETFKLDRAEMEHRHRETFELFDVGKITLTEYLIRVIFHKKRAFTQLEFRKFMFEQSQPYPKMIRLMSQLKKEHSLQSDCCQQ